MHAKHRIVQAVRSPGSSESMNRGGQILRHVMVVHMYNFCAASSANGLLCVFDHCSTQR